MLAVGDGRQHELACCGAAADGFDDDVDVRAANQRGRVGDQVHFVADHAVGSRQRAGRQCAQFDGASGAGADQLPVALEHAAGTAADGADAKQADAQRCIVREDGGNVGGGESGFHGFSWGPVAAGRN